MARTSNELDGMSYAELAKMEARIARLKIEKHDAERVELRERVIAMVEKEGFRDPGPLRQRPQGQRQRSSQIPRPAECGKYLDRPRTHAPLDGCGDERREVEERGFPRLSLPPLGELDRQKNGPALAGPLRSGISR